MREKVILLLPLSYNDGTAVPKQVLEHVLHELFLGFGGYTIAGEVEGAYAMKSGAKQIDTCLELWVAVEDDEQSMGQLRRLVASLGALLGQEAMYFERTGSQVDFVPAQPPAEDANE